MSGTGPVIAEVLDERKVLFEDLNANSAEYENMALDADGVLRIAKNGDLRTVVCSNMREEVLGQAYDLKVPRHSRIRRTVASLI